MSDDSTKRAMLSELKLTPVPLRLCTAAFLAVMLIAPGGARCELNQLFGWPRTMEGEAALRWRCPAILDIDGNSDWEMSILTAEGLLYIYQHDGANYPGSPIAAYRGDRPNAWERASFPATCSAGDIDGDGWSDAVYTTDIGYLHVMLESGREPQKYPIDYGRLMAAGIPVVVDLDGDHESEIIFHAYSIDPDSAAADASIQIYTSTGDPFAGWPVRYPRGSSCSPSVGDIDGDRQYEIVVANAADIGAPAQIYAWHQNGIRVDGFPLGNFASLGGSPALADLDGDGHLEILIWGASADGRTSGIYAYSSAGRLLNRYPLATRAGHPEGGPIVADIGGTSEPEIIFGTYDPESGAQIYAWNQSGVALDSFPIATGSPSVVGTVIAADVSGDGVNDIIAALAPDENHPGRICAWDDHARMIDGFPLELETGGFAGTPAVWDLDGDGNLDLIAITDHHSVMVWETPGRANHDSWPAYKAGFNRTGVRPLNEPYAAPRDIPPVPRLISLSAYPNPFNGFVTINADAPMGAPIRVDLADIAGRSIAGLFTGIPAGRLRIPLNAGALRLAPGAYLCRLQSTNGSRSVKLIYLP